MYNCPKCGNQLNYIQQYNQWYCYACQQYFQQVQTAQPAPQPQQQIPPYPYQYQQPPPMQYVPLKEKSILPIIAIIIVILVILVLVAAFFLFFMIGEMNISSSKTTPVVSMVWNEDPDEPGYYIGNVVAISGKSSINTDDVTITVTHEGSSYSKDLDEVAEGETLQVEDLTLDYSDQIPNGKMGSEDVFTITGGESGDIIRLVYQPTGGQMCRTTLT